MAEIRGLKFTTKGGPGSGNIGHSGRGGVHGESDSARAGLTISRAAKRQRHTLLKAVGHPVGPFGVPKGVELKDGAALEEWASAIPSSAFEGVFEVSMMGTADWRKGKNRMDSIGVWRPGAIQLRKGRKRNERASSSTLAHELGHAAHNELYRQGKNALIGRVQDSWSTRRPTTSTYNGWERDGFPTKYSLSNVSEYFAECHMTFLRSPSYLQKINPEMYAIMGDLY